MNEADVIILAFEVVGSLMDYLKIIFNGRWRWKEV